MPTYEYICTACQHEFEVFQGIKDSNLRKCPACNKMKVEKKISGGSGFMLKGSGFYETDYKKGEGSEYKKAEQKEKATATPAADSPCKSCPAAKDNKCPSAAKA
ncbi:MAG: zinc ribbon domain-containing protein [Planctomycetes bacterium]|nr:zinc ribbon domain-containing protein [Planctomycetota bacterium]